MTESQIVRQILDYLAAERIFAFRLNTSAFSGEHKGKRWFTRSHSLGAGAADILSLPVINVPDEMLEFIKSPQIIPTWIECKTAKGKQSPEQANFQAYVESLGHKYILARSVDDVRVGPAEKGL
jgi:hypothetical protein